MSDIKDTIDLRYNATVLDILLLIPHAFSIAYAVLYRLATRPFSSRPRASTLLKDLFFTAVRQHSGSVNVAQEALITISTEGGYKQYMKSQKLQPRIDVLQSGLRVLWYGPKDAQKTLLFFHGGGYAMACSLGHFRWFEALQKDLSKRHNVNIAVPAYELTLDKPAPKGRFPSQLKQASEALAWLINVEGRRPSDVRTNKFAMTQYADSQLDHCSRRLRRRYVRLATGVTPPLLTLPRTPDYHSALAFAAPASCCDQDRSQRTFGRCSPDLALDELVPSRHPAGEVQ